MSANSITGLADRHRGFMNNARRFPKRVRMHACRRVTAIEFEIDSRRKMRSKRLDRQIDRLVETQLIRTPLIDSQFRSLRVKCLCGRMLLALAIILPAEPAAET